MINECYFHFPAVRAIQGISSYGQLLKILEEVREFRAAAPGSMHKCVEAWDLIASTENWLRVQQAREGLDIVLARADCYEKNRARDYFLEGDPLDGLMESARSMLLKVCAERDQLKARLAELGVEP